MTEQRWLRIIPVALIMYTISYIDRTNISLALDPKISSMMGDLHMDSAMKGHAGGIFFIGYILLQIPGAYLAARWSARKLIAIFLVAWGGCAVACGLAHTFRQFEVARFLLGVAESGVFPATTVLLASWFPSSERARANCYWHLCQPLAVAGAAPITGALLDLYSWKTMLIMEGMLPFLWLPIWWFCIRDHPREAKWISAEELNHLETTLQQEATVLARPKSASAAQFRVFTVCVMVLLYFLHNCAAYGCMTFFTEGLKAYTDQLKDPKHHGLLYGVLFAIPYAVTAVIMVLNSRHSDKTHERRGHVAAVYIMSGVSLILSTVTREHFWVSYVLMCLAIPGPFAAMAPFWAIPSETLPRTAMALVVGTVNAVGNIGGYAGQFFVGFLEKKTSSTALPFALLGVGMLIAAALAFLLPKSGHQAAQAEGA